MHQALVTGTCQGEGARVTAGASHNLSEFENLFEMPNSQVTHGHKG